MDRILTIKKTMITLSIVLTSFMAVSVNAYHYVKPPKEFIHGIKLNVDGKQYYIGGAASVADGPNGEIDLPGHEWLKVGYNRLVGKHLNDGPFGAESWWASTEEDGILLYSIKGVIDSWSEIKSLKYHNKGFGNYVPLVSVEDGATLHPKKVLWVRHVAVKDFTMDVFGLVRDVEAGQEFEFFPNWNVPYPAE